eukprot:2160040-Pleurochrysis_carterae.AAC.1
MLRARRGGDVAASSQRRRGEELNIPCEVWSTWAWAHRAAPSRTCVWASGLLLFCEEDSEGVQEWHNASTLKGACVTVPACRATSGGSRWRATPLSLPPARVHVETFWTGPFPHLSQPSWTRCCQVQNTPLTSASCSEHYSATACFLRQKIPP